MAKTNTVPERSTEPAASPVARPAPQPHEGGSYTLDDATGERVLVERTEPNTQARSKQ